MFSYSTHRSACGIFRSSAPTPTVTDTAHPCLLWQVSRPSWRKSFVASRSCVGLFYLDTTYAVRILSGPSIYVPATSPGNLLIGSDGDSAMEARPISLLVKDVFHKVIAVVPRPNHPTPPSPLLPTSMLGTAFTHDEWPRFPREDQTPPAHLRPPRQQRDRPRQQPRPPQPPSQYPHAQPRAPSATHATPAH